MVLTEVWKTDEQVIYDYLFAARQRAVLEALKSPCVRRKYGAIFFTEYVHMAAHNNRVSRCCNGVCIRDLKGIEHGHNTDLGAEVHAEQALLLNKDAHLGWNHLLIVGHDRNDHPFYDKQCWPCYSCARMIKQFGIKGIWVPLKPDGFKYYLIDSILEEYEGVL